MAAHAKMWIDGGEGYAVLKAAFESTSRFAKLKSVKTAMAGRTLFVRFATATGDAMGMNMISKGTEKALEALQLEYPCDGRPCAVRQLHARTRSPRRSTGSRDGARVWSPRRLSPARL